MSLKIKNLNKKFGRKQIFENFSYEFQDTGLYILTADSGVGKTTLFRIIAGLDKDYSGDVFGGGIGNVSVCFQEYRLFENLSALKNITEISFKQSDEESELKAIKMLSMLGFTNEEMYLYPTSLSGGMKQRVALARAILKKSDILLLDEPDKELDDSLLMTVYKLILEEANERLVILVSHKNLDNIFPNANRIRLERLSLSE